MRQHYYILAGMSALGSRTKPLSRHWRVWLAWRTEPLAR